jgi:hypothetical protein
MDQGDTAPTAGCPPRGDAQATFASGSIEFADVPRLFAAQATFASGSIEYDVVITRASSMPQERLGRATRRTDQLARKLLSCTIKKSIGAITRRRHRLQRPRPAPVSNCVWPGLPYTYVIASAARYPTCTCHERDATPLCQHGGTSPEVSAAHPICPGSSRRSRAIRTRRPASADWMVVEIRSFSH